jgi:hypothetical protein
VHGVLPCVACEEPITSPTRCSAMCRRSSAFRKIADHARLPVDQPLQPAWLRKRPGGMKATRNPFPLLAICEEARHRIQEVKLRRGFQGTPRIDETPLRGDWRPLPDALSQDHGDARGRHLARPARGSRCGAVRVRCPSANYQELRDVPLLAFGDNVVVSRQRSMQACHSGAIAMSLTKPSLKPFALDPGHWPNALGDPDPMVRLQEYRDPVLRFEKGTQELDWRSTIDAGHGQRSRAGRAQCTTPASMNARTSGNLSCPPRQNNVLAMASPKSLISQRDHRMYSSGTPRGDIARRERYEHEQAHNSGHGYWIMRADAE